jgi:hypothetical protein
MREIIPAGRPPREDLILIVERRGGGWEDPIVLSRGPVIGLRSGVDKGPRVGQGG